MVAFMLLFNILIAVLIGLVAWGSRLGVRAMWQKDRLSRMFLIVLALTAIPAMVMAYSAMWITTLRVM